MSHHQNDTITDDMVDGHADKFKVGDKVIGNDEAGKHYAFTKKGWIGTVKSLYGYNHDSMTVEGCGGEFSVNVERFDLYSDLLEDRKKANRL